MEPKLPDASWANSMNAGAGYSRPRMRKPWYWSKSS